MDIADIRRLTPSLEDYVYFNTSGFSPKPEPVTEEVIRWMRFHNQGPALGHISSKVLEMFEEVRARVGRNVNATADDIMLNENATVGINVVAYGIDWQPGDNVILSNHEHPGNRITWYNIATRYGVELRFLPLTHDEDQLLDRLEQMIDARTRLVSISHVSRRTGQRLPGRRIADLVHQHDLPILYDGAQSFGSIPVDVQELDCDFYTFSGHKFIMGPQGTGAFYVRRDRLEWLKPSWIGSHSQKSMDDKGTMQLLDSARRFEFGTRNMSDHAGFGKALEIWEAIGWEKVFATIAHKTDTLKAMLQQVPNVTLATPLPYAQSSGIVTIYSDQLNLGQLASDIFEHERISASPIEASDGGFPGLRISVHVFHTDEEFERLVTALLRVNHEHSVA